MICIECGNFNIECLYDRYESDYIKLTICPRCEKVVDKYIEFDNVILFIDVLLLKRQAYRHLAYNLTETELLKDERTHRGYKQATESLVDYFRTVMNRYKHISRLILLIMLFEVYLIWAYEERKPTHSLISNYILNQKVQYQYLFFILKLSSQQVIFNGSIILLFQMFGWGSKLNKMLNDKFQFAFQNLVLLTTVLISSSIKLFPILMLIWPYDKTSISSSLINLVGFIILMESLKIVTDMNVLIIFFVLGVSTIAQLLLSKMLIIGVVFYYSGLRFDSLLHSEYLEIIDDIQSYKNMAVALVANAYK